MNDYWGPPRHDLPPVHAMPNPTNPYQDPGIGGGNDWSQSTSASSGAPYAGGGYANGVHIGDFTPRRTSLPHAIALAFLFGPLGLFYISILNGIAGLIALPTIVRPTVLAVAGVFHRWPNAIDIVLIPVLWAIFIPWAIIATKIRNARFNREG